MSNSLLLHSIKLKMNRSFPQNMMAVQISFEHNHQTIYCTQTTHQALHHCRHVSLALWSVTFGRHVSLALWSVTFGTLVPWGCIVVCKLTPCLSRILFCPLGRQVAYRNFIHSLQLYKPYQHKKLRGLSPHANYTDRAAAAGRRS